MSYKLPLSKLKRVIIESASDGPDVTLSWDTYVDILDDRRSFWSESDITDDVWDLAIEYIKENGVPDDPDPKYIVDNLATNSEVVYKDTWKNDRSSDYAKYDGDWDKFCEDKAITFNDKVAVLNFGW